MKLRSFLVVVAMLSLAGCKDKKTAPAKTTENGSAVAEAKAPEKPKLPLPAACEEYRVAIDKLSECTALPLATRDALKKSFEQAAVKWATIPADGQTGLSNTCKAGAEAINKTLATCK